MIKCLVFACVLLTPNVITAQQIQLKQTLMVMLCGSSRTVTVLANELDLIPLWKGTEDNGVNVTVWQDLNTKQFLISKTDSITPTSCIISMGGKPGV